MQGDARIAPENVMVIPKLQYESSGWPTSFEVANVIKMVKAATGQAPIPTRAYRVAGVHSWSLSFQDPPSKDKFTIEVTNQRHEILLVESHHKFTPKMNNRQAKQNKNAKTSQDSALPDRSNSALHVVASPSVESARIDMLESKVNDLEKRQTRFEQKFDSRLDTVDSALRQLLQRSEPARSRDTTGDTPPPKFPKNA